ncbi:hypothetical protein TSUD_155850 [Trifolium subterraneum]|uniref:Response regulatory domain-containing protein n=1 Tax=Trifolium subterraneum TaxID=3900 RepID=A0A2Z6NHD5_TRISU|nr:hypothetical protein TSUD_155850 [Trifolium subterraneum]
MNLFTANIPSSFLAGLRVLTVDHDASVLYTIHHICNSLRYQVTTCCTISRAMHQLFQKYFDIILIETHIPYQDTYAFVQQMTSLLKIPVINEVPKKVLNIMNCADLTLQHVASHLQYVCTWENAMSALQSFIEVVAFDSFYFMTPQLTIKHVFSTLFTTPAIDYAIKEAKELKRRGRDDVDVSRKAFSQSDPHELEEAKRLKKRRRYDVDVSKQPLAKKTRLSWRLDLHQKFMSAVNHLGINNAVPKKVLKIMDCVDLTLQHVASHLQKNNETRYSMTAQDQCHDNSPAEQHSTEIDFDFQGHKNNETQYSMTSHDQCHDKSPAEQHWLGYEFLQLTMTQMFSTLFTTSAIDYAIKSYWTKPLYANLFKNTWQHVVRKSFSQSDPNELEEAKGLKKRGRDDVNVMRKGFSQSYPHELEEAKGIKKRRRDDVDVSKQPLVKKTHLSWTLDLHEKFMSAVNHLGLTV